MRLTEGLTLLCLVPFSSAFTIPWNLYSPPSGLQQPIKNCPHTNTSRHCWGELDIDTDWHQVTPDTGRVVEVWLSIQEGLCNLDGYRRPCMTFNGTVPGPAIMADWGDTLVVHVSNNMVSNATSVHWHGVWQRGTVESDGVPGITQCPIPPGGKFIYRFRVEQYGSTWYHSHINLQIAEGLFGPLIFNGPATSNYDEDLGAIFLQDWLHAPSFATWFDKETWGVIASMSNTLINGTNTFDCSVTMDPNCIGDGKKFQMTFQAGKKYRLRLINVATDSQFQFSIDGHRLTIIANDLVPIRPYEAESVIINSAQRYDVIVEANAPRGNYWIRGGWVPSCIGVANDRPGDMTGILRYDVASTAEPRTRTAIEPPHICLDEPYESLVPYLPVGVGHVATTTVELLGDRLTHTATFRWTLNDSSLVLDWGKPTLRHILEGSSVAELPESYNVVTVDGKAGHGDDEWAILIIENKASGLFGAIAHPIHMHGHDFAVLAQAAGREWDGTSDSFRLDNPPRRDVAMLPAGGYLALAFQLDNPGTWLVHCHIAWHATQGLALEIVESPDAIRIRREAAARMADVCAVWDTWSPDAPYQPDGSGI